MFNQCVVGFGCKLEKKTMVMEAKGGYKCSMLNGHEAVVENGVWIRPRILMLLPLTGKTVFQPFGINDSTSQKESSSNNKQPSPNQSSLKLDILCTR